MPLNVGSLGSVTSLPGFSFPNYGGIDTSGQGSDPYGYWGGMSKVGSTSPMSYTGGGVGDFPALMFPFEQDRQKMLNDFYKQSMLAEQQRPWQEEDRDKGFRHDFNLGDQKLRSDLVNQLLGRYDTELQNKRDYDLAAMGGGFDILGSILGKGYIDQATHDQAIGRYDPVLANWGGAYSRAQNIADNGAVDWGRADSAYNDSMGVLREIGYSPEEINQIAATMGQEVGDAFRGAAEQTFNTSLGGNGSPAAAAALMAKSATEQGKAKAGARTNAMQENEQLRLGAGQAMVPLSTAMMNLTGEDARAKLQGLGALGELLGLRTNIAGSMADIDMQQMPSYMGGYMDWAKGLVDSNADGADTTDGYSKWLSNLPGWLADIVGSGNIPAFRPA